MKYRPQDIDISANDIFNSDRLNRGPVVKFFADFLVNQEGPLVVALDSPWGGGKTTVVRMLQAKLATQQTPFIYFNAWKVDYTTDPLVALIAELDDFVLQDPTIGEAVKNKMASVRGLATSVVRHGAVAAVKALTLGVLDIDPAIERVAADAAGEVTKDVVVASFQKEKQALEQLRTAIGDVIATRCSDSPLIFCIDELDRCRPSFAIAMLERIKHLFDVGRLVFVLSVDKQQLEATTCAVYGEKTDAPEYLRRFFDLEFRLPQLKNEEFVREQIKRFGLETYFAERKEGFHSNADDGLLISFLTELANLFGLSLRAIERAMARIALVCSATPTNRYLDPGLVAFLVILRLKNHALFEKLAAGEMDYQEVMSVLRGMQGGTAFANSNLGCFLEGYLVAADDNETRRDKTIDELDRKTAYPATTPAAQRARNIRATIEECYTCRHIQARPSISCIAKKVEMASALTT